MFPHLFHRMMDDGQNQDHIQPIACRGTCHAHEVTRGFSGGKRHKMSDRQEICQQRCEHEILDLIEQI